METGYSTLYNIIDYVQLCIYTYGYSDMVYQYQIKNLIKQIFKDHSSFKISMLSVQLFPFKAADEGLMSSLMLMELCARNSKLHRCNIMFTDSLAYHSTRGSHGYSSKAFCHLDVFI